MHILKDFITIDDLETRWGLDKKQIGSFTYNRGNDEPRLTMWYATERRTRPDGGQSAFVKPARYLNGCIFDMADVLDIERLNPELVPSQEGSQETNGDIHAPAQNSPRIVFPASEVPQPDLFDAHAPDGEHYDSAYLMQRYELGSVSFVNYLMAHRDLCPVNMYPAFYLQHDEFNYNDDVFYPLSSKIERLKEFEFHYRDIRRYEQTKQPPPDQIDPLKDARIAELEAKLAESQKRLENVEDDLEFTQAQISEATILLEDAEEQAEKKDTHIADLEKEVAELKEQLAAHGEEQEAEHITPQQKAAVVKGENTLKAWKPSLTAMIKVAVRCGEEGKTFRQRPDFYLMFNELNATLSGEQEKFFRESLPDEHIDRLGDARK